MVGKVVAARVTTKGQITIPVEVRRSLSLRGGDSLLFRLGEGDEPTTVARVPNWDDLYGSVPVPEDRKDWTWEEIREFAWREATSRHLAAGL